MRRIASVLLTFVMLIALIPAENIQADVSLSLNRVTILVGQTVKLNLPAEENPINVIWKSSNKKVASVNSEGVVTGLKKGKAVIAAKVNGKTYKCKVRIKIGIEEKDITLYIGETETIKLCGTTIKSAKSDNPSIASVDKSGVVKAISSGNTIIKIKGNNKKNYNCNVTVKVYNIVLFQTNGGSEVPNQKLKNGERIIRPDDPIREGYNFAGWYDDPNYFTEHDFNKIVESDCILYAKWNKKEIHVDSMFGVAEEEVSLDEEKNIRYINDSILAFVKPNLSEEEKKEIADSINGTIKTEISGDVNLLRIQIDRNNYDGLNILNEVLNNNDNVYYSSCDYPIHKDELVYYNSDNESKPENSDWWIKTTGFDQVWNKYYDHIDPVTVGVIDNGIDISHEDLDNKISFASDYYKNLSSHYKGDAQNVNHGTHVCGIIGANKNSFGITGGAYKSNIVFASYLTDGNENYNSIAAIINSLNAIRKTKAKVINCSLGCVLLDETHFNIEKKKEIEQGIDISKRIYNYASYNNYKLAQYATWDGISKAIAATMCSLISKDPDFLIVQAAGNGMNNDGLGPGLDASSGSLWANINAKNTSEICSKQGISFEDLNNHILIVSGIEEYTENGIYRMNTNYNYGEMVDICAPSVNIYSTVYNAGDGKKYTTYNGTSMAAPIVTATAALVWGAQPSLSAKEVRNLLLDKHRYIAQGIYKDSSKGKEPWKYPVIDAQTPIESLMKVVTGKLVEEGTDDAISGAEIQVTCHVGDLDVKDSKTYSTNSNGIYSIRIPVGTKSISIEFQKDGYVSYTHKQAINDHYVEISTVSLKAIFAEGDGTSENPYKIYTAEQLNDIRNDLTSNYILMNDIDLKDYDNWEPIGQYKVSANSNDKNNFFSGHFDGNGYNISNVVINLKCKSYSVLGIGLFGVCDENAIIENLSVNISLDILREDESNSSENVVGAIAGRGGSIINCDASGNIKVSSDKYAVVGGVVGSATYIKNCTNLTNITVSTQDTAQCGGIVGMPRTTNSVIEACVNKGNISCSSSHKLLCGGISGECGRIFSCENYGDIYGEVIKYTGITNHCNVGGINGGNARTVCAVYNEGNVQGYAVDECTCYVGGIVGWNCDKVLNVYNNCKSITSIIRTKEDNKIVEREGRIGRIIAFFGENTEVYSYNGTTLNGKKPDEEIGTTKKNGESTSYDECISKYHNCTVGEDAIISLNPEKNGIFYRGITSDLILDFQENIEPIQNTADYSNIGITMINKETMKEYKPSTYIIGGNRLILTFVLYDPGIYYLRSQGGRLAIGKAVLKSIDNNSISFCCIEPE